MNCVIVVVDAWKNCEKEDIEQYPWLEQETKLFGSYLNVQLTNIKEKYNYDIIHCADDREIMDEIKIRDHTLSCITDLPLYDYYYFCGFHLGRCINKKIKNLNRSNCGIIYNLSLIFPEDSYQKVTKRYDNNYMYSYAKGFEKCSII